MNITRQVIRSILEASGYRSLRDFGLFEAGAGERPARLAAGSM